MDKKFYTYEANNGELIKNRLEVRGWEQTKEESDIINGNLQFVWRCNHYSKKTREKYINAGLGESFFFNHFENEPVFVEKDGLIEALSSYYQNEEATSN